MHRRHVQMHTCMRSKYVCTGRTDGVNLMCAVGRARRGFRRHRRFCFSFSNWGRSCRTVPALRGERREACGCSSLWASSDPFRRSLETLPRHSGTSSPLDACTAPVESGKNVSRKGGGRDLFTVRRRRDGRSIRREHRDSRTASWSCETTTPETGEIVLAQENYLS